MKFLKRRRFPNGIKSISSHAERIEVTSMGGSEERDLTWSVIDDHGHFHSWDEVTWKWVLDGEEFFFDADGEEYNGPGSYRCVRCDDVVVPGTVYVPPSGRREFLHVRTVYEAAFVDGRVEEISGERYAELARTPQT